MSRIFLLMLLVMLLTAALAQAQSPFKPKQKNFTTISSFVPPRPAIPVSEPVYTEPTQKLIPTHTTRYHAAPVVAAPTCAPAPHGGHGCAPCAGRKHCDWHAIWEWLTYRPLRCTHVCSGKTCVPVCMPELYQFFLPCASGPPPRLPGCVSCGRHCGGHCR